MNYHIYDYQVHGLPVKPAIPREYANLDRHALGDKSPSPEDRHLAAVVKNLGRSFVN